MSLKLALLGMWKLCSCLCLAIVLQFTGGNTQYALLSSILLFPLMFDARNSMAKNPCHLQILSYGNFCPNLPPSDQKSSVGYTTQIKNWFKFNLKGCFFQSLCSHFVDVMSNFIVYGVVQLESTLINWAG